jgi:predicted MFS family arabinose efflux permease
MLARSPPDSPAPRSLAMVLADAALLLAVAALSLLLLGYIGHSEAGRAYPRFLTQKLAAQAELVRSAMDTYLQAGLPLRQFVGFATLAEPIITSDSGIASLTVHDRFGRAVFVAGDHDIALLQPLEDGNGEVRQDAAFIQVALPLKSRFEMVGTVAITMRRDTISARLDAAFRPLAVLGGGLALGFAITAAGLGRRPPWVSAAYAATFLVMAAAVVTTLVALYADGAQAKAQALANSLGQRIGSLLEHGLVIEDVEGLDRTFGDYRRLNPDIVAAGLIVGDRAKIHTDPVREGQPWASRSGTYDYVVTLREEPPLRVAVALPSDVVYRQVGRAVKNFTALFLASALLAGLFLQLATGARQASAATPVGGNDRDMRLIAPVFFLAVFVEHLMYPFLPKLLQGVAAEAGLSAGFASALFMTYFLFFALSLIPSGHLAERFGPKLVVLVGTLAVVCGLALLAGSDDLWVVILARAVAGLGQGAVFIGAQSYLLASAAANRKTQAAAMIVSGFQGGMIAGVAIGSLLVVYVGPTGIFLAGAAIGAGILAYAALLLPALGGSAARAESLGRTLAGLWRDIAHAATDLEFLKTMLTVGIPSKAVMTGVIVFALPLLLGQRHFDQEDIGQIIMLYGIGVLLASAVVARLVDRTGGTTPVLFGGSLVAAGGLAAIGLFGLSGGGYLQLGVLLLATLLVGAAHGCINAPVITHVAESELARRIGSAQATATYRFLERLGHVGGPMLAGQLLLIAGQAPVVLVWIAGSLAGCALLFLLPVGRPREVAA